MKKLELWSRSLAVVAAIGLGAYILFVNTIPFDVHISYQAGSKHVTSVGPANRTEPATGYTKQTSDLVYFSSDMPFAFDHAQVTITYKNSEPNQAVSLGYKDQASWHYNLQPLSAPFIDQSGMSRLGSGPYLYQRTPHFASLADFFAHLPTDRVIGTYDFAATSLTGSKLTLPDYHPATGRTVITTPLRGPITFYAYLDGEPFDLTLTKRDLNWYADPDLTTVSIYKDGDKVLTDTIADDGDITGDHHLGIPETGELKNPGPGLPEPGIYKVVVDQTADSVITDINTSLSKLVFAGPLYPVSNHEIYGDLVTATTPTVLYSNVLSLSAQTFHDSTRQTITADGQPLVLATTGKAVVAKLTSQLATVTVPLSDVTLNGPGYFAFSAAAFFTPTPYHILPITSGTDVAQSDDIITSYSTPELLADGWQRSTLDFELHNAAIQKRQLSWLLSASGLGDANGEFDIGKISLDLSKKGWWNR